MSAWPGEGFHVVEVAEDLSGGSFIRHPIHDGSTFMARRLPKAPSTNTITPPFRGQDFNIRICKVGHTNIVTIALYKQTYSESVHFFQLILLYPVLPIYVHYVQAYPNQILKITFFKSSCLGIQVLFSHRRKCYIALMFFELNLCSKANPKLFNVLETMFCK